MYKDALNLERNEPQRHRGHRGGKYKIKKFGAVPHQEMVLAHRQRL
ncbi:hypothetical protein NSP_48790 [Nodularia spumigena CCY9414]|nr:hypothetical protein NSP_48790 [Nodularia spumigena CCY9414]